MLTTEFVIQSPFVGDLISQLSSNSAATSAAVNSDTQSSVKMSDVSETDDEDLDGEAGEAGEAGTAAARNPVGVRAATKGIELGTSNLT